MIYTENLKTAIQLAMEYADSERLEFVTPEVLFYAMCEDSAFECLLEESLLHGTIDDFRAALLDCIEQSIPRISDDQSPEFSEQYTSVFTFAESHAMASEASEVTISITVNAMMHLRNSWIANLFEAYLGKNRPKFLRRLITADQEITDMENPYETRELPGKHEDGDAQSWRAHVVCVNDHLDEHNPLIGREAELERTIQVLCRKDKNNPLHLGEPGVGKTSIVYGLAQRINDGNVPERLRGARIYSIELSALLAGTQYRGDFEKRLIDIMRGVEAEKNAIVYIDEIHNIVGAGRTSDGSMDASNMLKPYLERGAVRFIGATTHEEYQRNMTRSKGMIRRFQTIDIDEPDIEQAINIIRALKPQYETFHQVTYDDDALEFAVRMSAKHITDRYLPDKAIDLMDEAGALVQMGKSQREDNTVDRQLIAQVLARVAHVDALAVKDDDNERLDTLRERITGRIYGQGRAVAAVVEAVQLAKAGLTDEGKPLASLLFVGPTGVGKTEVARVLAQELNVDLVRFDMSEYQEKHTVAKLIGSPAGYVGYDDGGLLTDAVRRAPDCVLLLDEIEKAHSDVFDILLQVMDYGVLTDNKGQKAYFRNVILIMTSNAGARFARQAAVGFASPMTTGKAMLDKVKKTFKPEFVNRLSEIVVFADMDRPMAEMILDKKLRELQQKLDTRHVTLRLTEKTRVKLIEQGFSELYGGREIDRVLQSEVKTRLMRQMLFGTLRGGGIATLDVIDNEYTLTTSVQEQDTTDVPSQG